MYIFKSENHRYINLSAELLHSIGRDLNSQRAYFEETKKDNKVLKEYIELAIALGIDLGNLSIHDDNFVSNFLNLIEEATTSYTHHQGYSATGIIELYKFFDKKFWSTYKALQQLYIKLNLEEYFQSIVKRLNYDYGDQMIEKLSVFLIDKNYIGNRKSLNSILETIQEEIKQEWKKTSDDSLEFGNMFHNMKEELAKSSEFITHTITKKPYLSINKSDVVLNLLKNKNSLSQFYFNTLKKYNILDIENLIENNSIENYSLMLNQDLLEHLPDGYYSELLVTLDNRGLNNKLYPTMFIKGQIDKLYVETDPVTKVRYVDIGDYKTNKKISKSGMYLRAIGETQKMKGVLDFLDDCNFNHYTIQQSLYAYMLEKAGFVIRKIWIENFDVIHNIVYMKDLIDIILKDINFNTVQKLQTVDDLIDLLD